MSMIIAMNSHSISHKLFLPTSITTDLIL
jgi:hypothetical protein